MQRVEFVHFLHFFEEKLFFSEKTLDFFSLNGTICSVRCFIFIIGGTK